MAETAIHLALKKIGLALRQDDSFDGTGLVIFQSKLRRIESELRMIHCFLDQLETRYNNNQAHASWINEAQKLGCLVEETVDVHIHRLFQPFQKSGRQRLPILRALRASMGLLMSLEARHEAFVQLTELEEELRHLSKMKKLWVQVASGSENTYIPSTREMANLSQQQLDPYFINGEGPFGYGWEKSKLETALLGHSDEARAVVAVWGPAGSGKTTLVRSVYEHTRSHFDRCEWISMSGCSSAEDILIQMRRKLRLEDDTAINGRDTVEISLESLSRSGLTEKNWLVVFDDIKVTDGISRVCELLQAASRIIIITQIKEVAHQVTQCDEDRIKLAGLHNVALAKQLVERVLLGKTPKSRNPTLTNWWSTFPSKIKWWYVAVNAMYPECKFLPQVIVSLGASLSLKQKTQPAFQQMLDQLAWVLKHNSSLDGTKKCLYVAYINLPMHLKVCLLYCGIFPAGYPLWRDKLVRLWAAEGFIEKQRPSEVEEEIAEGYLMELIRWGFLQRADSDELGRLASLRMPIGVHELVQSICRKEGFGTACDDELPQMDTDVRCLFASKYPQDICSLIRLPHLRTLIFSDSAAEDSHIENPIHTVSPRRGFNYLTVLDLEGYPHEILPAVIGYLFNLRYLGLRKSKVQFLPASMSRLYNMQTLDLEFSNVTKLPEWIGKLAKLRYLLASCFKKKDGKNILSGVEAPKSTKNLTELQTFETVEASADFLNRMGMLTQLRSLCVSNVDSKSWRTLLDKISDLGSLNSISVSAKDRDQAFDLDERLPFKPLKFLKLSSCKWGPIPLERLSKKFPNLESLSLYNVSGITKLEFHREHFTNLKTLDLFEMGDVDTLLIPEDGLAGLQALRVKSMAKLNLGNVGHLNKIKDVKNLFFPLLRDLPARTDEAESSSKASQS
ncbi:hypothetical protein ACP70R_008510 [Stipagrostis hirtigluma subsp. patula]